MLRRILLSAVVSVLASVCHAEVVVSYEGLYCITSSEVPPIVPLSPSVAVADVIIRCENTGPEASLTFGVSLLLNAPVTSLPIDTSGQVESMLLLNEPAPADVVLGANAFYAKKQLAPGGTVPSQLRWDPMTLTFPANYVSTLRLTNLFADTRWLRGPSLVSYGVFSFLSFDHLANVVLQDRQQVLAYVANPNPQPTPVPEPANLLLTACAGSALLLLRARG